MKRTIQLGRSTKELTPYPLFPDPTTVFHEWTDELAARILPMAPFDLSMAEEEGTSGPGVFLYTEDLDADFLSWKVEDGKITELENLSKIEPFEEAPDLDKIRDYLGGYLEFTRYEIEIGQYSQYEKWSYVLEEKFEAIGVDDAFNVLRVGGGYPVFVQSTIPVEDDPGFIAELPVGSFELNYLYLYLYEFNGGFQQIMQMT